MFFASNHIVLEKGKLSITFFLCMEILPHKKLVTIIVINPAFLNIPIINFSIINYK